MKQIDFLDAEDRVKETSKRAYREAKEEGIIGAQQGMVLSYLREVDSPDGMTGREIDSALAAQGDFSASYHKRLSELGGRGLIRVWGQRKCRISGRMADAWVAK